MTEGYDAIARVYDKLNEEIDYEAWADFIEQAFSRFLPGKPELVLDLACGTGSMTLALAARGYDMIGVDGSEQMLSVAMNRYYAAAKGEHSVLYLHQDMRAFELYGTVGAVVCCLDSLNYLPSCEDLAACFGCVHMYLDPDGLFLFDVNAPYKFRHVYGDNAYILTDEISGREVYCGWQNHFSEEEGVCDFDLTLFSETEDGTYIREDEHQREYLYTEEEIRRALEKTGFEWLGVWSGYGFEPVTETSERLYIAARAKK